MLGLGATTLSLLLLAAIFVVVLLDRTNGNWEMSRRWRRRKTPVSLVPQAWESHDNHDAAHHCQCTYLLMVEGCNITLVHVMLVFEHSTSCLRAQHLMLCSTFESENCWFLLQSRFVLITNQQNHGSRKDGPVGRLLDLATWVLSLIPALHVTGWCSVSLPCWSIHLSRSWVVAHWLSACVPELKPWFPAVGSKLYSQWGGTALLPSQVCCLYPK